MLQNSNRVWVIRDGLLGTINGNTEGTDDDFKPASLVVDSAEGMTAYFQSAGLRKCFDIESRQNYLSFDHVYCLEHKCALARLIVVNYAGRQTIEYPVPDTHFIPIPVDEATRAKLQETYIKRLFRV